MDKISINLAINVIDLEECFTNETVETQVFEFNELLLNFYSDYSSNKIILRDAIYDEKDPPRISGGIRTFIKMNNDARKG